MSESKKLNLKELWEMRNLSVGDFLAALNQYPALKYFLTTAGIWFVLRLFIGLWIGVHAIYLVYRIFNLVLV